MKSALLENSGVAGGTAYAQSRSTVLDQQLGVDQLARAVGEHALRQAEIDQKMVTRIVELREQLSAAKEEITSLRSQVNQLILGFSQGLEIAKQPSAIATKSALQTSLASLRSR